MTKQTSPFIRVSVNRYGFNVLDVRIQLLGTDEPVKQAVMLLSAITSANSPEDIKWFEESYELACKKYIVNADEGHVQCRVGDDLVSITRYDEYTIY